MASRPRLSLDGLWNFWIDPDSSLSLPTLDPQRAARIAVPAPWQADERFRDATGAAWYQRSLVLPGDWLSPGCAAILGFGAVDYFAEVWLNGVKVGEHEGGYLPFELDVTAAARPGENTLTVRVDDPLEIFPEIPHGKQSWYGMLSGLWQPVWVESRPAAHIRGVKVTPQGEQVQVEVAASGELKGGCTALVTAPDGSVAARARSDAPRFTIPVPGARLWSPEEPNLYTLTVATADDEVTETFGFRTIETRGGQILLNGQPFYLRGALDQDYYPGQIATPPSQAFIEDEFRKAKAMGLNCLRVHIKVADPRYYAAADKVGLLIWTELPNAMVLSGEARRRARQTIEGMVARDWNHPSIGIWTVINESWGIDLTDPAQRAWLAETYAWLKQLDPTRLVVGNSACWGNYHVATDLADFHNYYAMPDHHEKWREWVAGFARRAWWVYAHPYEGYAAWREFSRDPWHSPMQPPAPEVCQTGGEPLVVSEFGNWGLPDVASLTEGGEPWWFETGLEWGDGIVYPRGIQHRFKAYHLDRVFPSLAALSEASQRLQYDALKYEIEQIRRHESIQGYVITELTDVHWECNGLLDMNRGVKAHYNQMAALNADDLLIPLWERLAYAPGETCHVPVLFSHYSPLALGEAVLEWRAVCHGQETTAGRLPAAPASPFGVTALGEVAFAMPPVERPARVDLELRLVHARQVVAASEQAFYAVPAPAAFPDLGHVYAPGLRCPLEGLGLAVVDELSGADMAVVTRLDDACRQFLLRGGRVLFLAEEEGALHTNIPDLYLTPRERTPWQGDWASSFGWHRFATLPTGGVVNFAFAGLTPEQVIRDVRPFEFAHNVFAGLFVGWLHKPVPTIARRKVGPGELVVSTFRLSKTLKSNPLALYLLSELIRLASGLAQK